MIIMPKRDLFIGKLSFVALRANRKDLSYDV